MRKLITLITFLIFVSACSQYEVFAPGSEENSQLESRSGIPSFSSLSSIDLGPTGAAEISAFDPATNKLFVVNNTNNNNNRIDVVDLSNPSMPVLMASIAVAPFGGLINSVAVSNGTIAAGIESMDKVSDGKVVIFNTADHTVIKEVKVGALPDMVTFSPDGHYILSANEGEPNLDYSIDPLGTVSIIEVANDYAVTTLNFDNFKNKRYLLEAKGMKIFGPNASFAQDIEPEYIAVSANSKTAWVTLQENNAVAQINIQAKTITDIFPLGFKNYQLAANTIDPSDQNGGALFANYPVKGMYEPDGIAVLDYNGNPLIFTANEGDAREYSTYEENLRYGSSNYKVDPNSLQQGAALKPNAILGRLNVSTALGDIDHDGDFDQIYTHGGRSFTIWNGRTGDRVFDSRNDLENRAVTLGVYPENRSDDKGTEPETVVIGKIGSTNLLFVGLERANAVAIYDISNPINPVFLQILRTGEGPEGIVFVPAAESPSGQNLLIVSCETEGVVNIFSAGL